MPDLPPLLVKIYREPFIDFFQLTVGESSEELDPEDTRDWFRVRGANMDIVEKALDHSWNFRHATLMIENPKEVVVKNQHIQPRL